MRKRILVIVSLSLVTALVVSAIKFLGFSGGFVGNLDKQQFENMHIWFYEEENEMNVVFEDFVEYDKEVWVEVDKSIEIKVDPSLTETVLSAHPKLLDKIFGTGGLYRADSVVVWVQSGDEKQIWDEFISYARERKEELIQSINYDASFSLAIPYTKFTEYDVDFAINNIEFVVYGVKLAIENPEFTEFQEAFEQVLAIFRTAHSSEAIEEPVLGLRPMGKSIFGPDMLALYEPEINVIVLNSNKLEYFKSSSLILEKLLFHEVGHAWFEQAPEAIQNAYYNLVVSQQEESPYSLTRALLNKNKESIDKTNTNIFILRAVKEDFAESFALHFAASTRFYAEYPERLAFFCSFVFDSHQHCSFALKSS